MRIAVIEWASDDAECPAVFIGSEEYVVQAAAVAMHNRMADDPEHEALMQELGFPGDGYDVWHWHQAVRWAVTSPWVTFYRLDDLLAGCQALPDSVLNRQLLGIGVAR